MDKAISSEPSVAVLLPVYNGDRFIGQAIQTVMDQSYTKIRLIVIDDASTDNTCKLLEYYKSIYKSRILIVHSAAKNQARALNTGLAYVNEDFVSILDVDDLWSPVKISLQLAAWARNPTGLVVTDFAVGQEPGEVWTSAWETCGYQQVSEGWVFHKLLLENFVLRSSALMPTTVIREFNGFDETISGTDDMDLWLRIAERYPISCVWQVCCFKRVHEQRMSLSDRSNMSRIKMWEKWLRSFRRRRSRFVSVARRQLALYTFDYAYLQYKNNANYTKAALYFVLSSMRGYLRFRSLFLAVHSMLLWARKAATHHVTILKKPTLMNK